MARTLPCQSHLLPVFPQVGKVCPHLYNWLTPASPSDLNVSIIFSVKDLIILPSTLSIYLLFFPIALMTTWYIYMYIWLINFSIPSHHWTINSTETGPLSKIAFSHLHQCLACGSIFSHVWVSRTFTAKLMECNLQSRGSAWASASIGNDWQGLIIVGAEREAKLELWNMSA